MMLMRSVLDFANCAKPLIFEDGEGELVYTMLGTCFLVKYGPRAFVITAQHCLRHRSLSALRIRLHPGMLAFVRLAPVVFPRTEGGDVGDLALFAIHPASISAADLKSSNFLDLGPYRSKPFRPAKSAILALVGFPAETNMIAYEDHLISTQGIAVDGRYCGRGEEPGCSKIRFNNLGRLTNINGLSGSPVVQFTPSEGRCYKELLAGHADPGYKGIR